MDTAEEHDRFIAAQNGGALQNCKATSNNGGVSNGLSANESDQMYKSVAVCVEPKVQLGTRPCKRRCCLIAGVILILLLILVAAAVIVFLYYSGLGKKTYVFSRSPLNMSNDRQNSSGVNYTMVSGVPMAEGRPYWTQCPGVESLATVYAVHTKDCVIPEGHPDRCTVKKDTTGIMQVVFRPKRDIEQLSITSCGTLTQFPITCFKQELKQPDACRDSNLQCPLRADQVYTYSAEESVRINFMVQGTEFNVDTQVTMTDPSNGDVVFCVIIPIRIYI